MAIVDSRQEFENYIVSLNTEICRVWEHWNVLTGVHKLSNEYALEMNQSSHFWRIVSRSLQDVVIIRLANLLDHSSAVVSMPRLLHTIKGRAIAKDWSLGITLDNVEPAAIEEDIKLVSRQAPVVAKIQKIRNKILAHRDKKIIVTNALHEMPELPDAEIDHMIGMLHNMVCKYCALCGLAPILLRFPGSDDYKRMLALLRTGFAADQRDRLL